MKYWNNTKFADWIRGVSKPKALPLREWSKWKKKVSNERPIRFWIAEKLLPSVENVFNWPTESIYKIKYYIVNRWVDQSHALVAHPKHIAPGHYMDLSYRILYCLFDELVDHVEIERAYLSVRWDKEKTKNMKWWQAGIWRTRTYRNASAGLEYLQWETTLTNEEWLPEDKKHEAKLTPQAIAAKEIIELYKWWVDIRPNRPDPYDESGWSDHCEDKRNRGIGIMEEDPDENREETRKILDRCREIENNYEQEDTEMLTRLIAIRGHLWT